MKTFISTLLCLIGLSSPVAAEPISAKAFTQEFAKALASKTSNLNVTVKNDMELQIQDSAGKESTAFLDNAYSEYLLDPKSKTEIIQKFIIALIESRTDDTPVDRARIVPVVKDRPWLVETQEALKARGSKKVPEYVYEDINNELIVIYAEDNPKNIKYLTPQDLEKVLVKKKELKSIAVANLKNILPKIELHTGPLISMITAGGDYEASLLLFDDLWTNNQSKVDGEIVVAIPSRDLLLFTGSKNAAGIAKLREVAAKSAHEAAYRLTAQLFIYRNGKFEVFK